MASRPRTAPSGEPVPPGDAGASARMRLLDAAARVFAQHGASGATTRRIADQAGVNEVTLFRLFGSKDALLEEAVHAHAARELPTELPGSPVDPPAELAAWCAGELRRLRGSSELLRQCFAQSGEQGSHVHEAGATIARTAEVLHAYVERLAALGPLAGDPLDRDAAVAMLVSTVVADGLARGDVPGVYTASPAEAPHRYARTFLRALGWSPTG